MAQLDIYLVTYQQCDCSILKLWLSALYFRWLQQQMLPVKEHFQPCTEWKVVWGVLWLRPEWTILLPYMYIKSRRSWLCFLARLFINALWSPAGKGLTSWLSFVMSNCEVVTFPLVSWVRCGAWLYRFLIFALFLTLNAITNEFTTRKERRRCVFGKF